jgi:hypothetical protein
VRAARRARLDHEALELALKKRFGDHLLGESTSRLVIPAFMIEVDPIGGTTGTGLLIGISAVPFS